MKKQCFKCSEIKDLTDFYKHPQMPDGRVNKCKECNKNDVKENYLLKMQDPLYVEKERLRGRKKHHTLYSPIKNSKLDENFHKIWYTPEELKVIKKISKNNYIQKFPEKRKGEIAITNFKKIKGVDCHHWSYNDAHLKDIIQITKKYHLSLHNKMIYDKELKMYRRKDTNELLNTKEVHLKFIKETFHNINVLINN